MNWNRKVMTMVLLCVLSVAMAGFGGFAQGTTSVFSAPTNVMATSSDGTVMVVWMLGNGAASQVIVVVNVVDDTDYCLGFDDSGTASSYECTGRAGGATYVVLVIALDGEGGYTLGKDAQGNLVTHTVAGASTPVQLVLAVAEVPDDLPAYNRGRLAPLGRRGSRLPGHAKRGAFSGEPD